MAWLGRYVVAAVIFGVLDYLWLGVIARPVYEEHLGDWLADSPNMVAALAFYAIYVFGMVWLAITPALAQGSWVTAVLNGAVLGLVAYATWNLTNLAVLDGYPSGRPLRPGVGHRWYGGDVRADLRRLPPGPGPALRQLAEGVGFEPTMTLPP